MNYKKKSKNYHNIHKKMNYNEKHQNNIQSHGTYIILEVLNESEWFKQGWKAITHYFVSFESAHNHNVLQ